MVALAPVVIKVKCDKCDVIRTFELCPVKLKQWLGGQSIQKTFPSMSINDRETLISWRSNKNRNTPVICGECFDKMFGVSDD